MAYNGLLTLKSAVTESIFLTKTTKRDFSWNGEYVGAIDDITNLVSTRVSVKLYYCAAGYYFSLESYSELHHCVEILKEIFDIPRKLYNICTLKSKRYFMFYSEPDYEHPGKISKYVDTSDNFKVIALFHWIIGVNGKYWVYKKDDEQIIFSKGPYRINYSSDVMPKSMIRRIFDNKTKKDILMEVFDDKKKLDRLNDFIASDIRWWYLKIIKRIDELT
jgi:hypothetical protein